MKPPALSSLAAKADHRALVKRCEARVAFVVYATALEGGGSRDVRRDAPRHVVARLRKRRELP